MCVCLSAGLLGCGDKERQLSDKARTDILAWAGVTEHRGSVAAGADMYLLTVRAGAPLPTSLGPTAERPCIRAQTFLPGPVHDPRVFYIIDGALHAHEPGATGPGAVKPLTGLDGGLTVTDLLAFGKGADKVELLALIRKAEQEKGAPWLLHITDQRIVSTRATGELPAYRGQEAFFARFQVPKCQREDRRCVIAVPMSGKNILIVEEPQRGQKTRPVSGFDNLASSVPGVKDVAWVAGDTDALYLALGCRAEP